MREKRTELRGEHSRLDMRRQQKEKGERQGVVRRIMQEVSSSNARDSDVD